MWFMYDFMEVCGCKFLEGKKSPLNKHAISVHTELESSDYTCLLLELYTIAYFKHMELNSEKLKFFP